MEPLNISNVRNRIQADYAARNNYNVNETAKPEKTQAGNTAKTDESQAGRKVASAQESQSSDIRSSVYGNVLDISEDGDTVTARPEALKALDDGIVIFKGEEDEDKDAAVQTLESEKEAAEAREEIRRKQEEADRKAEEARERLREQNNETDTPKETAKQTGSLNGYSDNMVDTLYRQGKIDAREYNAETSRRERMDEMKEQGNGNDETADRVDRLSENARELGELNAKADQDALEDRAYETAAENGRVAIMQDIFSGQDNN